MCRPAPRCGCTFRPSAAGRWSAKIAAADGRGGNDMARKPSRRDVLKASGALALTLGGSRVLSAAPAASAVTPDLIAAAKKEGKVVWYTSIDLAAAERVAKSFEAKYPGVATRL